MKKQSNAEIVFKIIGKRCAGVQHELKLTQLLYKNNEWNPDIAYEYGYALIQECKFKEAIELALKILKPNPYSPKAIFCGYRLLSLSEESVLKTLQKGQKIKDIHFIYNTLHEFGISSRELYVYFAFSFLENKQKKKALHIYKKLKKSFPNLFGLEALAIVLGQKKENKTLKAIQPIEPEVGYAILRKLFECVDLKGENRHEVVSHKINTFLENKNYPPYETDILKDYLTITYEGDSHTLEALELFNELLTRHPHDLKQTEGLLRSWAYLQVKVEMLIEKDPNLATLESYYKILQEINYVSHPITKAMLINFTHDGRYNEAKKIIQELLSFSPHKINYLEMALEISELANDYSFKEIQINRLVKLTKQYPFLYYHQELLKRFTNA